MRNTTWWKLLKSVISDDVGHMIRTPYFQEYWNKSAVYRLNCWYFGILLYIDINKAISFMSLTRILFEMITSCEVDYCCISKLYEVWRLLFVLEWALLASLFHNLWRQQRLSVLEGNSDVSSYICMWMLAKPPPSPTAFLSTPGYMWGHKHNQHVNTHTALLCSCRLDLHTTGSHLQTGGKVEQPLANTGNSKIQRRAPCSTRLQSL